MTPSQPVLLLADDPASMSALASELARWSIPAEYRPLPAAFEALLDEIAPSVVVLARPDDPDRAASIHAAAKARQIPALVLVEPGDSPQATLERVRPFEDWLARPFSPQELATRVLALRGRMPRAAAIDPRFLALSVHDLRTPLNVIGLTIRAISQSVPAKTAEFEEDLLFLQENARQIERMLAQLGDFCRLLEIESPPHGVEFDLCRFLEDFVEDRAGRTGADANPIVLDLAGPRPREVSLDPNRTRMALQHAVANAATAAGTSPVRIELRGDPSRVLIEVIVDRPPPSTVKPTTLRPDLFERLAGSAAERRGLDLAIAARISQLFGGTARLDVDPGRRSSIVLDWPARIDPA